MKVGERGRLVDEYTASEVLREMHADLDRRPLRFVEHRLIGGVDRRGQRARRADGTPEHLKALAGRRGGDQEGDGSEPLAAEDILGRRVHSHDQRGTYDSGWMAGMLDG